ncbi:AGC family protein kinase [Tritrichomonas foetus]|uniref:AGC family protein kinase n=1 Tax=Tritrichomonas foetus TaxID=1144522 RepID=A0A1J4KPA9_9EUKA|nr:AGC family protein kinase [Tritrichomonas foetus]|eukprot:OHT12938.1 AGC family protein kinase [Tritrichomonas foetus]
MKGLCERAGCSDNFPSYMSQLTTRGLIPINFPKSGSNANISSMNSMNSMNSINSFNNLNVNTSGSNQNPTNGGHGGRRTRSMIRTGSPFSQFYHTIGNLGEGGYGKVMKIQNLIDRQFYALKVIRIDRSEVKMAFREVQCLAHLQSPRLVRYFNAWIEGSENSHHLSFYIQTEFVEGQSLANFLSSHSSSKIDEKVIHHLLIELTLALNDIHSAGVVHRDFRPSNVMLRPNGSIVVIDFGISSVRRVLRNQTPDIFPPVIQIPKRVGSLNIRPFDQIMIREAETPDTTIKKVGTPIYSSPQQLNGHKSTPGDDIYSLGIIMFEMLGQFRTDMEKAKMVKNLRNFNEVPASFKTDYPEETEMILKMIDKERGKRLSTVDILESDLFQRWMHEQ